MALPTTMSQGTRIIWNAPYQPPVQQLFSGAGPVSVPAPGTPAPPAQNIAGSASPYPGMQGVGPFVGLCTQVAGAAPDFVGSRAVVFDAAGAPFVVSLGVNVATWQSGGSQPSVAHWAFIDLSA